jgi:hypothetical protein
VAAIERCAAKEGDGIAPDTFAEVGKALFWLIAWPKRGLDTRSPICSVSADWGKKQPSPAASADPIR